MLSSKDNPVLILIAKVLRSFSKIHAEIGFSIRLLKLKLLYPSVHINAKTRIHKGCSIVCVDGGTLSIINSEISSGTHILAGKNSKISIENTFIGRNCVIVARDRIMIGKNSLIAEMVVIRDQDHQITNSSNRAAEGFTSKPVELGENVWVGAKATILKGVKIGHNAVVGSSSLVLKDIPSDEVWAGVPARLIYNVQPADCATVHTVIEDCDQHPDVMLAH